MNREDRLEIWGGLICFFSILACIALIIYSGFASRKYSYSDWGDDGFSLGYILLGIGVFFNGIIVKQILDGIAEIIRLKRPQISNQQLPHKNCPACDESIRESAKVCRYCRYVLVKKDVSNIAQQNQN